MTSQTLHFPFDSPFDRQPYLDVDENDETGWDIIQPKYDGIWARLQKKHKDGNVLLYSRTSQVKTVFDLPKFPPETVVIGEFMYGSQWAQAPERLGKVFVFDCVAIRGLDVRHLPYSERLKFAREVVAEVQFPLELSRSFPFSYYDKVWSNLVSKRDFEGLVFRKWHTPYEDPVGRRKLDVTDEFVVLDALVGKGKNAGRLGALVVGKFSNGVLKGLMSVGGGFSDAEREEFWHYPNRIIGAVVEVVGKARFDSGALRHPNFVRIRTDKRPEECIL